MPRRRTAAVDSGRKSLGTIITNGTAFYEPSPVGRQSEQNSLHLDKMRVVAKGLLMVQSMAFDLPILARYIISADLVN